MYDRVLVPTDGSDAIDRSLEHALHVAERDGATLEALYVVDRRIVRASKALADDIEAELRAEGEAAVSAVAEQAADAGVSVETTILSGTPDTVILERADETDADLIVIGSHGKSPREKLALGSVSERVVQGTSVPVLVVET